MNKSQFLDFILLSDRLADRKEVPKLKLKAVVNRFFPSSLVEFLESDEFRAIILANALVPHLHVPPDFGPAEFYIQECDFTRSEFGMCEIRLTGVSVTENRSTRDYYNARNEIQRCYGAVLEEGLPKNNYQIMASMMLDRPPLGRETSLIEDGWITIQGTR